MTYKQADEILGKRTIHSWFGADTRLERDGANILVRYHGDVIVTAHPDGTVVLTRDAYPNIGTRSRMSCWAHGWIITQCDTIWMMVRGSWFGGEKKSFMNGVTISPKGTVTGDDPEPPLEKRKAHKREISKRSQYHRVKSAGDWTEGDIAFVKSTTYSYATQSRTTSRQGPFRVRIVEANDNGRVRVSLSFMDGRVNDDFARVRPTSWRFRIIKDNFLSAAAQAKIQQTKQNREEQLAL